LAPTEESTASELNNDDLFAMYPNCLSPVLIGNGKCDVLLNTTECGFDGGDCDRICDAANGGCEVFNSIFPDCVPDKEQWYGNIENGTTNEIELIWPYWLKDGLCDAFCEYVQCGVVWLPSIISHQRWLNLPLNIRIVVNTPECNFDDGDCLEFNEKYPDCTIGLTTKQCFQGVCSCFDPIVYSEECGWDGGDCEGMEEICEETASYENDDDMAANSFAVDSQQCALLTFLAAASCVF
jgi:LNR domain